MIHGDAIDAAMAIVEEIDAMTLVINETGVSAVGGGEREKGIDLKFLVDASGERVREEG